MLTKKKVTKTLLQAAAQDLNTALVLSPSIPIDGKFTAEVDGQQIEKDVTKTSLEADLIEFGKDDLQYADLAKLKLETIELLEFLGVIMPVATDGAEVLENSESNTAPKTEEVPTVKSAKATDIAPKKASSDGPGVIGSILEFIQEAPKTGISIENIHAKLIERFPDRQAEAMLKTVKAQVGGKKSPCRMEREKKVTFKITNGQYSL